MRDTATDELRRLYTRAAGSAWLRRREHDGLLVAVCPVRRGGRAEVEAIVYEATPDTAAHGDFYYVPVGDLRVTARANYEEVPDERRP